MYKIIALTTYKQISVLLLSKIILRNDLFCFFIRCGGVSLKGLALRAIPRKYDSSIPVLEKYVFVPNITELDVHESVRVNMQIILENTQINKYNVVEVIDEFTPKGNVSLAPIVKLALADQPLVQQAFKILSKYSVRADAPVENRELETETNCLLVIVSNASRRKEVSEFLSKKFFFVFDNSMTKVSCLEYMGV